MSKKFWLLIGLLLLVLPTLAQPGIALQEESIMEGGATFQYPTGWEVTDEGVLENGDEIIYLYSDVELASLNFYPVTQFELIQEFMAFRFSNLTFEAADVTRDALTDARTTYRYENIEFLVIYTVPFANGNVGLVVGRVTEETHPTVEAIASSFNNSEPLTGEEPSAVNGIEIVMPLAWSAVTEMVDAPAKFVTVTDEDVYPAVVATNGEDAAKVLERIFTEEMPAMDTTLEFDAEAIQETDVEGETVYSYLYEDSMGEGDAAQTFETLLILVALDDDNVAAFKVAPVVEPYINNSAGLITILASATLSDEMPAEATPEATDES